MSLLTGKNLLKGVALIGMCFTIGSCSHPSRPSTTQAERDRLESMLSSVGTVDSLKAMLKQFQIDENVPGQIVTLRVLGKRLRQENEFNEAIDYHLEGLKLAESYNDTAEMVMAYNNLGTNNRRLGNLEEAASFHMKANTLCLQHSDTSSLARKNYVASLNGLGNIYLTLGNLEQADSAFQIALQGERKLGSALGQAINLANIGAIKEQRGQTDSAWYYYRQSLQKNVEANSALGIGLCHGHFGQLYEKAHQYPQAIEEYQQALEAMKNSPDYYHRLEIGLSIAQVYITLGKMGEAKALLDEAKAMTEYNYSLEQRSSLHMLYYKYYERLGDARKALDNYIKSKELNDSVVDIDKVNRIQNLRLKAERNRQQAELQMANKIADMAQRSRNLMLIAFGAVSLLLLIIILQLFHALRTRIKTQKVTQQLQEARDSFFTNITHEFRTPLTVILGLGHQMEQAKGDQIQEVRSAAKMIVRQGNSLLGLINQLLDISKVRSAIGTPNWRHGNIIAFIQMVAGNYQSYAKSKHIELSYTHSLTDIGMDFVPDYMQKILDNLLSNAIKFTPTFGKVNITAEQVQNNLRLKVYDTGNGIDPKTLPHIFEPFYQGHDINKNIGTGVGLSLVKLMVEAMNGEVKAESNEGQGSTFIVTLPLKHSDKNYLAIDTADSEEQPMPIVDDAPAPEPTSPTHALSSSLANSHILIVEDNNDIAQYIGMHLKDQCHITYASNADDGFENAQKIMPDLIITDLMMPGNIDGLEFCRKVRQSDVLNHIPIIIITAKTTDADRVKGLEAGADAYLVKPFNSDELLVRVRKLLEQRRMLRKKFSADIVMSKTDKPGSNVSQQSRDFLNKFVDVVYANMASGKLDVETIADRMAMSRTQLNRKMLAITGENTSTYIMQLRMSKAKRLLRGDINLPIGNVAQQCGFDDVAYFSRIFKQQCDLTPSQYRKSIE